MNINQARQELAQHNKLGIPILYSAFIYWAVMLGLGFFIENVKLLSVIYLYGTGMLLPTGIWIAKLMNIKLFRKVNPLSSLSGILASTPAIMVPLTIYIYLTDPSAVPFTIAVITAGHFFPFAWLYQTKAYVFPSVFMMVGSSLGLIIWPDLPFFTIPVVMMVCLAGIILGAMMEKKTTHLEASA